MMSQQDLGAIARTIIDSIFYMVLGTADDNGQPWASPVYFASAGYREFYWISSPEVRHSLNIAIRPQVSIVVFDSRVAIGMGQGVYMSAMAGIVPEAELENGIRVYNGRFQNPSAHGVRLIAKKDVQPPALYRLYRAVAQEHWVLDRASRPDHRTPVSM